MVRTSTQERLVVAFLSIAATLLVVWVSGGFAAPGAAGDDRGGSSTAAEQPGVEQQLAALERENRALREQLAQRPTRTGAQAATDPSGAALAPDPVNEHGVEPVTAAFPDPDWPEELAAIDWAKAGVTMQQLLPLIEQIRAALAAGESPMESLGQLSRLNADLIELAVTAEEAGVPGSGPNGVISHPSVTANLMASTLAAAGMELSEHQRDAMAAALHHYREEAKGVEAAKGDHELGLEGVLAEAEMKERMYDEMTASLTEAQLLALRPESTRDRTSMDMFGTGLLWSQFARPVVANNPGEYAAGVTQWLTSDLRLDPTQAEALAELVRPWSDAVPLSVWSEPADPLAQSHMLPTSRVTDSAGRQLELLRQILGSVNLSAAQREKLEAMRSVPVPVRR